MAPAQCAAFCGSARIHSLALSQVALIPWNPLFRRTLAAKEWATSLGSVQYRGRSEWAAVFETLACLLRDSLRLHHQRRRYGRLSFRNIAPKHDRQGTWVAAHVFPPLGGHWRDFAFWADGLGELHQNPFATSIRSHSGHHWRVLGLGRAPMDRLCLVR
jgi:hypothetical protein